MKCIQSETNKEHNGMNTIEARKSFWTRVSNSFSVDSMAERRWHEMEIDTPSELPLPSIVLSAAVDGVNIDVATWET